MAKVDPLKAKAAKQKKIAIGLSVFLVIVVAVQGPRTMKMLKGKQPPAPAAAVAAPVVPAPGAVAVPTPVAPATGGAVAAAQPAALADTDLPPVPDEGQLLSFERFSTSDPFVPQSAIAAPTDSEEELDAAPAEAGAPSLPSSGQAAGSGDDTGAGSATPDTTGFTPADAGAAVPGAPSQGGNAPVAPALAAATSISVNGVAEDVAKLADFPAAAPVFSYRSTAADGRSIRIAVAGGSYANGQSTIELKLGKTLTLRNTADGTTYELKLLAVEGFAPRATGAAGK